MKVLPKTKTARFDDDRNNLLMESSKPRLPTRLWVEAAVGLVSAALLAITLIVPRWIELLFGISPDAGDGSTEWGLAFSLGAVAAMMFGFAGRTWRKHLRLFRSA